MGNRVTSGHLLAKIYLILYTYPKMKEIDLFVFSDAHTSSLMISDSDSDGGDEEIIFDDDLNRQTKIHQSSGMNNGGSRQRNGIIANHNQPRA